MLFQSFSELSKTINKSNKNMMKNVVSSIQTRFFPPRTLFFVAAIARGLQQSSSLKKSFDPTVGAGAIINFVASGLDEKWIIYIVSGWFISSSLWTFFGSKPPQKVPEIVKKEPKWFW